MRTSKSIAEKSTINLAQKEKKFRKPSLKTWLALAALLVMALSLKVGIVDPLVVTARTVAQAEQQEGLLQQTREALTQFDMVQDTYEIEKQTQASLSGRADVMDCLALIEAELLHQSRVQSFTIAADRITVRLSGVTLHEMSAIYQRLMASELVIGVQVYTASAGENAGNRVTTAMTIVLAGATPEQAPATEGEEGAAS